MDYKILFKDMPGLV